eukprot:Em0013g2a
MECARHVNLVKVPAMSSEVMMDSVLRDCTFQQKLLISQLVKILDGDHLARLSVTAAPHEAISRRLNTDRAARQFRRVFADVKWESRLLLWAHETLLKILDSDLLPVYLDILQVLKSKSPVLVEHMIHSSVTREGGEALGLLLKRPWSIVTGMEAVDRQVKFEPAPIFVVLPHASMGVYPVILPEHLTNPCQALNLQVLVEEMVTVSLTRVQELKQQYGARPIVLLGWSIGARLACRIAEVEPVSCIVSLGLPCQGPEHQWKLSTDPFRSCTTPTIFVVGSDSLVSSVHYTEELRSQMDCYTAMVTVGGGDDLLRLQTENKYLVTVTQSIVDRLVLEKIYSFLFHLLPCSVPDETRQTKRRKSTHGEDIGSTFLTPSLPQSPIILTASSPFEDSDGRNFNLNNNSLLWATYLGLQRSSSGSRSSTPSPLCTHDRPGSGELPRIGRPRSKSLNADIAGKKMGVGQKSQSGEQGKSLHSEPPKTPPIVVLGCNSNSNNNNNSLDTSPLQLLTIPPQIVPALPITSAAKPLRGPGPRRS